MRGIGSDLLLVAVGAIIVLGLVWFYGARSPSPFAVQPAPTAAAPIPSSTAPLPTFAAGQPAQSIVTGGFVVPAVEEGFAEPACGDFTCDANERCDTCSKDCGCAGGEYCNRLNGVCYELPQ